VNRKATGRPRSRCPSAAPAGHRIAAALAALALALAVAAPGARAAEAGCPVQPSARTFLPWLDLAKYVRAPDGGLESGGAGWSLLDGAAVQPGNEPYYVGGRGDRRSLRLPAGSSATTAPMCIGLAHPTIRFFARNTGALLSTLRVSVLYRDLTGRWQSLPIVLVTAGSAWGPTLPLPVIANLLALTGDKEVAFRFTPSDGAGGWSIDDVYVDPYGK